MKDMIRNPGNGELIDSDIGVNDDIKESAPDRYWQIGLLQVSRTIMRYDGLIGNN